MHHRILLSVTGLTPQVVTETVYALHRRGAGEAPHEIHVVTTQEGAERVRLALLSSQPGWFDRLKRDLGLGPIRFDESTIHVLAGRDGQPLADIRGAEDNALAADQIAELVRSLTRDAATSLHVSLAGGRKTLGYFAGYALSLYGRDQDRLSHVLASEPYESCWDFFYPTPYEQIIQTRDGKLVDCARAEVTLAEIPFVRLRRGLPASLLEGRCTFAQAVGAAQVTVDPPSLVVDLAARRIVASGHVLELPPAELAFMAWFARRAKQGAPALPRMKGAPEPVVAEEYLAEWRRIVPFIERDDRTSRRYRHGMASADFDERKSKLKRALEERLGPDAAQPFLVHGEGRRPMRYRLTLPADAIRFVEPTN